MAVWSGDDMPVRDHGIAPQPYLLQLSVPPWALVLFGAVVGALSASLVWALYFLSRIMVN